MLIDDFEDYNIDDKQIWHLWKDGLGYGAWGELPAYTGNGTGSAVGDETVYTSYMEETIVHGDNQSMPYFFDNNKQGFLKYSEAQMALSSPRNWTEEDVKVLTIWFRGYPAGFQEDPVGTYTMSASGADIGGMYDEFRFAYKQLSGAGTIVAQVLSVENVNEWSKAGVMIRRALDTGSPFAAVYITPEFGCRFQGRLTVATDVTSDSSVATPEQRAITAPYWIKLERDNANNFNGYYSGDGVNWTAMAWNPQNITMPQTVYIGLALTSHNANVVCKAQFSDVRTTGTVTPTMWTQDVIGTSMLSNDPEPMYVVLNDRAVVYHDDPEATQMDTWTPWNIDLKEFSDQGVNLTNITTIGIGFGDRNNPQAGGSGKMYFDDIRLYRSE